MLGAPGGIHFSLQQDHGQKQGKASLSPAGPRPLLLEIASPWTRGDRHASQLALPRWTRHKGKHTRAAVAIAQSMCLPVLQLIPESWYYPFAPEGRSRLLLLL